MGYTPYSRSGDQECGVSLCRDRHGNEEKKELAIERKERVHFFLSATNNAKSMMLTYMQMGPCALYTKEESFYLQYDRESINKKRVSRRY